MKWYEMLISDMKNTMSHAGVAVVAMLIVLCIYILHVFCGKKTKFSFGRMLLWAVVAFYFTMVIEVTLLSRTLHSRKGVEWTVIDSIASTLRGRMYIYENIMMFIPFGLFWPMLFRRLNQAYQVAIAAALTSAAIEALQYFFGLGVCQLSDLVMNFVGAMVGYVIYLFLSGFVKLSSSKKF